jgi:hypothetical protein
VVLVFAHDSFELVEDLKKAKPFRVLYETVMDSSGGAVLFPPGQFYGIPLKFRAAGKSPEEMQGD